MASRSTLDTDVEALFDTMLAEIHRLKAENRALLLTIAEKETHIVALQEAVHRLNKCGTNSSCQQTYEHKRRDSGIYTNEDPSSFVHDLGSWMQEEDDYVSILKTLLK